MSGCGPVLARDRPSQVCTAAPLLDALRSLLDQRKGSKLNAEERKAWRGFVDDYHQLVRAESALDRARALPTYGRRVRALEARGRRTLEEFGRTGSSTSGRTG